MYILYKAKFHSNRETIIGYSGLYPTPKHAYLNAIHTTRYIGWGYLGRIYMQYLN